MGWHSTFVFYSAERLLGKGRRMHFGTKPHICADDKFCEKLCCRWDNFWCQ